MKHTRLRGGVIGAGMIADRKHLVQYAKLPDVEIAAICDPKIERAQALADKYGIAKVYDSDRAMLDSEDLDFVCVCSPNALHRDAVVAAVARGIHVHCEKPVTIASADALEIDRLAGERGVVVMPAMNNRFTNNAVFLKEYIDAGAAGEIYHFHCGWTRRRGSPGHGSWFTQKALSGGGPLIDLGAHLLDLSMYFADAWEAETVTANTSSHFFDNSCRSTMVHGTADQGGVIDVEDRAEGFIRFRNGCTGSFDFSWASNIEKDEKCVELLGTASGAKLLNDTLSLYGEMHSTVVDIHPQTNYPAQALGEHEHFIACVRSGAVPIVTMKQAAQVMRVIEAAYQSAATRREVSLA